MVSPMSDTMIRTQWEYKVWSPGLRARASDERLTAELCAMGREGWEVVCQESAGYLLKRPC